MEHFILAFGAAVFGSFSGLFAPWVKWQIEKRKEREKYRRETIASWRTSINEWKENENSFGDTAEYASLRAHMRPEAIVKFEAPRTLYIPGGRGGSVLKHLLLGEALH